jgi:hypothetical protein
MCGAAITILCTVGLCSAAYDRFGGPGLAVALLVLTPAGVLLFLPAYVRSPERRALREARYASVESPSQDDDGEIDYSDWGWEAAEEPEPESKLPKVERRWFHPDAY